MCKKCRGWDDTDNHKDWIRGGVGPEDFDEDIPVRGRKKSRRKGGKRVCAKSKTDEFCTPDVWVESYRWFSTREDRWMVSGAMACARCGRHVTYRWGLREPRG